MPGRAVLLVEDNATTRKLVRFALERRGIEVLEAADAATAIKIARSRPTDVVLQDLLLPDLDGFELLRRLRATEGMAHAKILAFSGLSSRADDARISAAGFDDVITKPIEPSRLLRIVESNLPESEPATDRFGAGRRAIVADDDPLQQKLAFIHLSRAGFHVLSAADGKVALELARANPPDLVVSDVLMPNLDGFGLALAMRRDDRLKDVPILLLTSSYVESTDRELARRAGADDLVLRTPNLSELKDAARTVLDRASKRDVAPSPSDVRIERDLSDRIVRQLERHVILNTRMSQRCTALAAELRVLRDIAEAVLLGKDLDVVLEDVLAACLDAGGIALGALYLQKPSGRMSVFASGSPKSGFDEGDFSSFFGNEELLRTIIERGRTVVLPSVDYDRTGRALLTRLGSDSVLVVPVTVGETRAGALFMAGFGSDLDDADWRFFAEGVAHQVGLAISLARTVEERESARVRAVEHERIAAEQERVLRVVLDSTAEGVVSVDRKGRVVLWNTGAERMLGPRPAEVVPAEWPKLYGLYESDGMTLWDPATFPVTRGMAGEPVDTTDVVVRRDDSDERRLEVTVRPVPALGSAEAGTVVVLRDVTERRRAEAEITRSRAQWQAVVENAPDAILTLDREAVVQFANGPARKDMATAEGRSWFDGLPPEHRAVAERAFVDVLLTGETARYEVATRGDGGEPRWYAAHIGAIRGPASTLGAVVIGEDVTTRKRSEAQLIVSDRMASVGMLAAGVAHEINNPLAAVLTNLELAREEVLRVQELVEVHELSEELGDAWDASERVREIVKDLKLFSRSPEESHGPVDLKRLLESTSRMAWNEIRHRAKLVKTFADVPPVEANEARLGQVFLNLIVNAAQAIPEGKANDHEIRIVTRVGKASEVVVEVTDTGVGMSPEVESQLFRPFFTTKAHRAGTGLGLSICHRIVTSLGGRIEVRTEPGKGSTFLVVLPASNAPPLRPVSASAPVVTTKRGTVLVVDDEASVGTAIKRVLSSEHEVVVELSATAALERIRRGATFDVILCDVMMPVLSGMSFHTSVREVSPELAERIVFLTGGAFTERARKYLETVKNVRLDKPFEAKELRDVVADFLTAPKTRRKP
ncbi:MAG: response regulator [Polyangiaceae bacterium]